MKPDSIGKFVQELKRRRVFRGIVVYGASTLLLLEAAQNLCNVFGIEHVPRWFLWVLGMGFIASLFFSWIYDITPGGIKKTEPVSEQKVPIPKKKLKTYKAITLLSLFIIIGLLSYRIIDGAAERKIENLEKSIAVLPVGKDYRKNLETPAIEFIGHEITASLLKVKDYRVIPWEDTRKYSRTNKNYKKMGDELSAAILVDWQPNKTRFENILSVSLISAGDGSLIWAKNYEIEDRWTSAEIDRCCRHISRKITRKLRTFLTLEERELLKEQPAAPRARMLASMGNALSQDSWERVQTGEQASDTINSEYTDSVSFSRAVGYYTKAIMEDSSMAEAYANRAKAKLWGIRASYFDENILDECEEDIRKAFILQPELVEAYVAMGFYHYYGRNAPELALVSFEKAARMRPSNYEYVFYISLIERTLGNWDRVRSLSDQVFRMHPRNALFLVNVGYSYLCLHDLNRSIACQNRAIDIKPSWHAPYIHKIHALVAKGDITGARNVVADASENTGKEYFRTLAELDFLEGDYSGALEKIELAGPEEYYERGETDGDMFLLKARICRQAGQTDQANAYFNRAAAYFNDRVLFNPGDPFGFIGLGLARAGRGMDQEAIQYGEQALQLIREEKDAISTGYIIYGLIQIYSMTGNYESVNDLAGELLDTRSPFTRQSLILDPDIIY